MEEKGMVDEENRRVSLGVFLINKLVNGTVGSFTFDLRRPQVPSARPRSSLFTLAPPTAESSSNPFITTSNTRIPSPPLQPHNRFNYRPGSVRVSVQSNDTSGGLLSIPFGDSGARVKALRHVKFGPTFTHTKHGRQFTEPQVDVGAGASFEFDTAELIPIVRVKYRNLASLKLLPQPSLKLLKRFQIGSSGFGVRVSYECPIEQLDRFFAPPAKLLVTLDNTMDTGVRITQSGIEFAANQWLLQGNTRVRAAGILRLPSELPIDQEELFGGFDIRRLGVKSRW